MKVRIFQQQGPRGGAMDWQFGDLWGRGRATDYIERVPASQGRRLLTLSGFCGT